MFSLFPADVDECTTSSPVCDVNAICSNTLGSNRCTCKIGYYGDGRNCTGTVPLKAWLGEHHGSYFTVDFRCYTKYRRSTAKTYTMFRNKLCSVLQKENLSFLMWHCVIITSLADIDECSTAPSIWDINAICHNNPGSYACFFYSTGLELILNIRNVFLQACFCPPPPLPLFPCGILPRVIPCK